MMHHEQDYCGKALWVERVILFPSPLSQRSYLAQDLSGIPCSQKLRSFLQCSQPFTLHPLFQILPVLFLQDGRRTERLQRGVYRQARPKRTDRQYGELKVTKTPQRKKRKFRDFSYPKTMRIDHRESGDIGDFGKNPDKREPNFIRQSVETTTTTTTKDSISLQKHCCIIQMITCMHADVLSESPTCQIQSYRYKCKQLRY